MAKLLLLQSGNVLPFDLTEPDMTIGRHPDCDIQLDSNMVSRRHARIFLQDQTYLVEDLNSGNGSFVNGKRISEPTPLKHHDRIKFGPLLFRFDASAPPKPPAPLQDTDVGAVLGGFQVEVTKDTNDQSTILGSINQTEGYGTLSVQPEAKLKGVLEITRALAGTFELESILPKVLDALFKIFPYADRGSILLRQDDGKMIPAAQKHRRASSDESVKLSSTILNTVLEQKQAILSADAANDDRFQASESISALTIHSMICAPLLSLEGEPMGIINLDTQNPVHRFQKDDLDLLLAVAGQAAMSYEGARLMHSFLEKQKQDSEMAIAHSVQEALLPSELPSFPGYEFYASYDSAQAVGGDYYDVLDLGDGKIALSFGDVSGKGVPGALIMSRMSTVVQSTMKYVHEVGQAISDINNSMCSKMAEGRFVTYVLGILDTNTHELSLVNGGHMSPLIRKPDGTVDEFPDEMVGLPVGIMEDYPYDVETRTIEPGETVVIITDGVDEAMNPDGDLYTKDRVVQFVAQGSPKADELGKALLADVRKHANGRPQNDDITIMTFGRSQ